MKQDNQPVIHLVAKKPIGVLHLLDDESNFPKATDASFLEKCHYNHALNELYFRPRMSSMEFGIKHYAGQVRRYVSMEKHIWAMVWLSVLRFGTTLMASWTKIVTLYDPMWSNCLSAAAFRYADFVFV